MLRSVSVSPNGESVYSEDGVVKGQQAATIERYTIKDSEGNPIYKFTCQEDVLDAMNARDEHGRRLYDTNKLYRAEVMAFIAASDAVAIGVESPVLSEDAIMASALEQAERHYVQQVFTDPRYSSDPTFRLQVLQKINADPALAARLSKSMNGEDTRMPAMRVDFNTGGEAIQDQGADNQPVSE